MNFRRGSAAMLKALGNFKQLFQALRLCMGYKCIKTRPGSKMVLDCIVLQYHKHYQSPMSYLCQEAEGYQVFRLHSCNKNSISTALTEDVLRKIKIKAQIQCSEFTSSIHRHHQCTSDQVVGLSKILADRLGHHLGHFHLLHPANKKSTETASFHNKFLLD